MPALLLMMYPKTPDLTNKMLNHCMAGSFPQVFGMMFGLTRNNSNIRNV